MVPYQGSCYPFKPVNWKLTWLMAICTQMMIIIEVDLSIPFSFCAFGIHHVL